MSCMDENSEKEVFYTMKHVTKFVLGASTASLTGSLCAMTAFAEGTADTGNAGGLAGYSSLIFLVLMFVVLYFILIRPQKKKEKETKAMQSSLQVGDEIVTIGGIVGIVVQVGEDTVVVETTGNRNKIRLKSWAIQENVTVAENAKREQEAKIVAAKAKKEEKEAKKKKKDSKDSDGDQGMLKD